jgi:glutaredoxin
MRVEKTAKAVVTIYSRPGCHLCEEAKEAIMLSGCSGEIVLKEINIDDDAGLRDLYKEEIPVVLINGHKAFKYRVDPRDFKRKLRRLADIPQL